MFRFSSGVLLLDGPTGTELNARGVETTLPAWSASAIRSHPEVLAAIHRDYAEAGATVHTACTFRTRPRTTGNDWAAMATEAVQLCRRAVPSTHRVAGSMAPLEDCYRPELSPTNPEPEHRALAEVLARAGCDVLLCETFPHPGEALAAVRAARSTGLETWVALTAGPYATLLSPQALAEAAAACVEAGAAAALVNCVAATQTLPYVEALVAAELGVPVGAYANAGHPDDRMGWVTKDLDVERYATLAETWVEAGATLIGSCCGTGPAHVRALAALLAPPKRSS